MLLKCDRCKNMALSPPANNGDRCGLRGCPGTFSFFANTLAVSPKIVMLKCDKCGNVYKSGPTRRTFDECKTGGCTGKLDRFQGIY